MRNFYDRLNCQNRYRSNIEIEESNLAVEFSVDKITEVDQGMNKANEWL